MWWGNTVRGAGMRAATMPLAEGRFRGSKAVETSAVRDVQFAAI